MLIMLGGKLVGYSNSMAEAERYYDNGKYTKAYDAIAGMSMKKSDQEFYDRCAVLAMVQEQYDAYISLMDVSQYDMALDSLVRGVGRHDKYSDLAKEYGVVPEFNKLETQIEQALDEQFGVSAKQALEIYDLHDRENYSVQINQILEKLGLE